MAAATMAAATTVPPPSSPSKVSPETVENAVSALLKWKSLKSSSENTQLLPSDDFVYLVLTFHKIPPNSRTNAYKIPLPHPLFTALDVAEFCLFVDDRHLSSRSAKDKILEEKLPVAKVIRLSKLKTDYKPFEAKRKLCDSYDMFFADKRIIPLLPRLIGKQFYKKKKIPVPIELGRKNWKDQIDRALGSALYFVSTGSCSVLKVARGSMSKQEIVENVVGCINEVIEFVPKKWRNVRSLHLKFSESVALPVYQAVPEIKMKFGAGAVAAVTDGELSEGEKGEESDKSEKKKGNVSKKKGRIHEVRYMDDVVDEMVGDDESGSDDDGEMESVELPNKKRKNASGHKEVKKLTKVKKGDKGLKAKKEKVLEKLDTEIAVEKKEKAVKKADKGLKAKKEKVLKKLDTEIAIEKKEKAVKKADKGLKAKKEKILEKLDSETDIAEIAVEKRERAVKNTTKAKKGDVGLKQKKDKVLGKPTSDKKTKKSKVVA